MIEQHGHKVLTPEPAPLGAYDVIFRVLSFDGEPAYEFLVDVDSARSILHNLGQAIERLDRRAVMDVAAGPCDTCHNVRMVTTKKPGQMHEWREHCPACTPRAQAALAAVKAANEAMGS